MTTERNGGPMTARSPSVGRTRTRTAVVLMMLCTVLAMGSAASAETHCSFDADPPSAQFRGLNVHVTGSFSSLPNRDVVAILVTDWGPFGPMGQQLEPIGSTNSSGDFDFVVTIPSDHPTGTFDLTIVGTGDGFLNYHWCDTPYTVTQLMLIPGVTIATTTTLGLASPTTTAGPTTTQAVTTTEAETTTTVEETTTTAEETTTSLEETTTTDDLLAGDQVDGSGIPLWLILLVVLLVGTVLGLVGYLLGQRRRGQLGSGAGVPPPPEAGDPPAPAAG